MYRPLGHGRWTVVARLVAAKQLQLGPSWRADMLSLRYEVAWSFEVTMRNWFAWWFLCVFLAAQFSLSSYAVTVSAESVDGPTPAARVTWSTTAPPECVASVRVEFRTSSTGPVVANYTTNSTSQTEIIQTGLQCATNYHVSVVVTGQLLDGSRSTKSSRPVQVLVGGKGIVCMRFDWYSSLMVVMSLCRYTNSNWSGNRSHCRQHKCQSVLEVVTSGCAHVYWPS